VVMSTEPSRNHGSVLSRLDGMENR